MDSYGANFCFEIYTGLFRNGFLGPWWFSSFSDFVIKTFHSSSLPILSKKRGTWYLSIKMIRQEKVPLGFFQKNLSYPPIGNHSTTDTHSQATTWLAKRHTILASVTVLDIFIPLMHRNRLPF
jgi:hypothetical protein